MLAVLFLFYWFCLPDPLFKDPTCLVLEANDGSLLGAQIAADGQWRFPLIKDVPLKFEKAILAFEDKRFYSHPGVDLLALGRAFRQNIKNGKVVSGGSTLTMQVIRLARKGQRRTVFEKAIEMVLATRLELRFSKKEILALYASYAPFGGNVVGLETATWRYFGKRPSSLSWAEAATLAVLPNNPSMIHPARNRDALKRKRNRLLKKLFEEGVFDELSYELALEELLPGKPLPLPRLAPHLMDRVAKEKKKQPEMAGNKVRTTIDKALQEKVNQLVDRKNKALKNNEIHNLAAIIINIEKNEVLAYVGNAQNTGAEHGNSVDIITAPRSTGSILKPFLYAMMMQEGKLLPKSLVNDIPTQLKSYRPENYSNTYDGVVAADRALSRSLNIPFVRMLQEYSVEKFHFNLKKLGITTLRNAPVHYGLTLILGGSEATLWDLTSIYAGMSRRLSNFYPNNGWYSESDFTKPIFYINPKSGISQKKELSKETKYLTADAIWLTFEAMKKVERPNSQGDWQRFESSHQIAWKTGTSYGFRDAWAIGVTPKYAVGVWAGNADGEGRSGLVGIYSAAPLLFEIFDLLPTSRWFDQPFDAMKQVAVCHQSGYLAKDICEEKDTIWAAKNALKAPACPYHRLVHLDKSESFQVNKNCVPQNEITARPWFVLPPVEEYYFKIKHPNYRSLPPVREGCQTGQSANANPMQLIYPGNNTKIYVPTDLDGNVGRTVFKAAHRFAGATIHWHIDREYIGSTTDFHNMELNPPAGRHSLTLVDDRGNRLMQAFEILLKEGGK